MMKLLMGLVVVGAIALVVMYFKSYKSFDPTAQGKAAKDAIKNGMTYVQVVAAAGDPQKYRVIGRFKEKMRGEEIEVLKPGPQLNYDKALFAQDAKNKAMPDGFIFEYIFSHQAAFAVSFDSAARVTEIEDLKTMADLLGTRGP